MADGTKKPKGWLIAALIAFLLSIAGCGAAGFGCSQLISVIQDIDVTDTVPMGQESSFVAGDDGMAAVLLTSNAVCQGTDDEGGEITFDDLGGTSTVSVNEKDFTTILTFDVKANGSYALVCGNEGEGEYTVIRLPSFLGSGAGILAMTGGFFAGGLFLLLAIIFLIVGLVRRSSWKKRQMGGGMPPVAGAQPYGGSVPPPPGGAAGAVAAPMVGGAPPPPGGAPAMPPPPGQVPAGPPPAPPAQPPAGPPPAPPAQPPAGPPPAPPAQPPGGAPPPPPAQPPGGAPPPPPVPPQT
jgi:hypothetical protein